MTKRGDDGPSVQINYTHAGGGYMTAMAGVRNALDLARTIHEQGHRVGSVACYRYGAGPKGRAVLLAIWYASAAQSYFGDDHLPVAS